MVRKKNIKQKYQQANYKLYEFIRKHMSEKEYKFNQ